MQSRILIEGDEKGAKFDIMCNSVFLAHAVVSLFERATAIDSDGQTALLILSRILDIYDNENFKK